VRRGVEFRGTFDPGTTFPTLRTARVGAGDNVEARAPNLSIVGSVPTGDRRRPDPATPRTAAPGTLARIHEVAATTAERLFSVDPLTGDPLVQQGLDRFVEQAVDALRTIAELANPTDAAWAANAESAVRSADDLTPRLGNGSELRPW